MSRHMAMSDPSCAWHRATDSGVNRAAAPWSTVFTVAFVPTGMNAGVGTSPCAVCTTPARAAPSAARSVYASLIDAHVTPVDDEVAAVLEAQAFVVRADPRIVAEAVEPEELAAGGGGGRVGPLDDRLSDAPARARAAHGELVHVRRVRHTLAPVDGIVPEQGHGGGDVAVELPDVDLPALDRGGDLLTRKRERPLLVSALADPRRRFVQQRGHRGHVGCLAPADVHRRSIASPNE